jgi:NADPH-dependent 2,4-dienoyl-CoA reductase/sulfur reductase-like enzyme
MARNNPVMQKLSSRNNWETEAKLRLPRLDAQAAEHRLRPSERPTVTEQTSTSSTPRRIVVAGGGPAAHRFADAMHARGLEGWHVTVLTEEAHLPYDRVALSKALTDMDYDLTLGEAAMWDHASVDLKTGERVVKINA